MCRRWVVLVGVLVLAAASAQADLMQLGLFEVEEGLLVRDTDSGLEWLRFRATRTDRDSDPPIEPDLSQWLPPDGEWSYASATEICDLLNKSGAAPSPCPGSDVSGVTPEAVSEAIDLLGATFTEIEFEVAGVRIFEWSAGVFETSPDSWGVVEASVEEIGEDVVHTVRVEEDASEPLLPFGHALVRAADPWPTVPASTRQPDALPEGAPSFFGSFPYQERNRRGGVIAEGVTFRVWAPNSRYVVVVAGSGDADWTTYLSCEETAEPACWPGPDLGGPECPCSTGVWSGDVPGARVGDRYRYLTTSIDGPGVAKRDPRGRLTAGTWHPYSSSVVYDPFNSLNPEPHVWTDQQFHRPPQEEVVIFNSWMQYISENMKFADVVQRLDDLRDLGFSTIQLIPATEHATPDSPFPAPDPDDFCNGFSWVYSMFNMSDIFAVDSFYGGPDEYKRFVNEAHARDLAVHAQVKINNLPFWALYDGTSKFDGWYSDVDTDGHGYPDGIYFSTPADLGTSRPNFASPQVRDTLSDYIRMWLAEYHVDGLRWDQAGCTFYKDLFCVAVPRETGQVARDWSRAIHEEMHEDYPDVLSMGENLPDEDLKGEADDPYGNEGAGFDAREYKAVLGSLAGNNAGATFAFPLTASRIAFHFQLYAGFDFKQAAFFPEFVPGVDSMIKRIWRNGACGYTPPADPDLECGDELWSDPFEACGEARRRLAMLTALHLTMPALPIIDLYTLFLLPEKYGHVAATAVDWSSRDDGMWALFRELIHLRRDMVDLAAEGEQPAGEDVPGVSAGLTGSNFTGGAVDGDEELLAYHRWRHGGAEEDVLPGDDVVVFANLGGVQKTASFSFPAAGDWTVRVKTNDPRYGYVPPGEEDPLPPEGDGVVNVQEPDLSVELTLPPYTAVIFSQDCIPDTDGDGICDAKDNCAASPNRDQLDLDGDGVGDVCDNCSAVPNADQRDTNQEGYGNLCDADFDNDGGVGASDYILLSIAYGGSVDVPDSGYDPDIDMDGDGSIGAADWDLFLPYWGGPPGPSGLDCAGTVPCP